MHRVKEISQTHAAIALEQMGALLKRDPIARKTCSKEYLATHFGAVSQLVRVAKNMRPKVSDEEFARELERWLPYYCEMAREAQIESGAHR